MRRGDKVWVWDDNRRVYKDGRTIWREHWAPYTVVGENRASYLLMPGHDVPRSASFSEALGGRVPKRETEINIGMAKLGAGNRTRWERYITSEREMDQLEWVQAHKHHISALVDVQRSFYVLQAVARLVDYKEEFKEKD